MIPVPKYSELSIAKLWPNIKEVPELNIYFPDLEENELPERKYQLNLKILNLIFKSWLIKFNIRFHTTRVQLSDYSSPAGSFVSGSASTSFSFMSSISFFPFFPCAWSSVFFLTPQLHIFGGGIKYLIWLIKI